MKLPRLALVALALATASPHVTFAQTKSPKAADDARARELYQEGDAAYAEGRYEDALAAFEEAHRLSGRPRLLFNIGNALERLGKLGEAADALEKYLPSAKPGERDVLEKRIRNLRKRATPTAKVELEEEPAAVPESKDLEEPRATPLPKRLEARADAPEEASSPTLGWVLVGAGGVAMGAGAVFGLMALSARGDAEAHCKQASGQTLCSAAARDAVDRDQRYSLFADIGLGAGLVAAGAGVIVLLSAPGQERPAPRSVALDFAPGRGGGTLVVRGEL